MLDANKTSPKTPTYSSCSYKEMYRTSPKTLSGRTLVCHICIHVITTNLHFYSDLDEILKSDLKK